MPCLWFSVLLYVSGSPGGWFSGMSAARAGFRPPMCSLWRLPGSPAPGNCSEGNFAHKFIWSYKLYLNKQVTENNGFPIMMGKQPITRLP